MIAVFAVAFVEWRVRTRSYLFFLVLGLALQTGSLFVPDAWANYVTVDLAGYRGIYNSAWMGGMTAILVVSLVFFVGFFVIRESPRREIRVGVWGVIAASPLRDFALVAGKTLASFAVLNVFACAMFLAAGAMQVIRHENSSIAFVAYFEPYALIVLPVCAIVAAGGSLFDQIRLLQGIWGAALWIALGTSALLIPLSASHGARAVAFFDPLGISVVVASMTAALIAAHPQLHLGSVSIGVINLKDHVHTFVFSGIQWSESIVVERTAWIAISISAVLVSTALFDRFAQASRGSGAQASRFVLRLNNVLPDVSVLRLWRAECLILIGDAPLFWLIGCLMLVLGGLFASTNFTATVVSIALIWPVSRYAVLGSVDSATGVEPLVLSAPYAVYRVATARIAAGAFVASLPLAGVVAHQPSLVVVPFALSACALVCGSMSRSPRLFESIFIVLWYGGANHVPILDLAIDATTAPMATLLTSGLVTCAAYIAALLSQHARYRLV